MSGVETVAGLALGILPLLISAAEHYDDCLRPFIRYKNFAKEADRFRHLLGIQKTIFRNQCRILLEDIIEHDVASSMLNGPSGANHPSWSDVELEAQLSQLLGDSRDACIATVEMIKERLRDIEDESQDLEMTLHQDSQDTADLVGSKTWRRRIAKKLRFSFSKPRLDQTLCDLRSFNDDFRTLSTQTLEATSLQSKRQAVPPKKPYQEVERYQIIGQASRQVYEALGRACTKHTEHQAHFCVEVEQASIAGDHSARIKFNMAYTHLTLAGSADQSDLIWFVVDSTSGDTMKLGSIENPKDLHDSLSQSLKRQIEPATGATQKKAKKSVRFQSAIVTPTCMPPTLSTATIANAILSSDDMRKDFCDFIRRRLREPLQASECVGVLDNTDNCRNIVYPSSNKCCRQTRQAISLGQVILSVSKQQGVGGIPLYERLRLAKTLAIAVLQYHSTPWLRMSWRSEDVYFFDNELASVQDIPSLISPHLNVKVKGPCGQLSRAATFPYHNLARNPLLFSLGVVLLEIAYTSTLESLQSPIDLDHGRQSRYTEFFAARRLAKSAKTDMGTTYHKIIERLVECDFGCGTDLNDPQLQAAFHRDVICPLEKLEQKLREFHID
ncbi:MAG: hypothetical protein ALECFALPRED_001583 [Alectoria fallacina]|uniref:DUF7580 domain-containing protein n=1 Tax=Alectoria fallacina TaxID=1903189 RepID=A0A8H3F9T4_9LECA|nr:MAG: hypothetical protein ALECFALPRED_001583 [Alectoria fallacina]